MRDEEFEARLLSDVPALMALFVDRFEGRREGEPLMGADEIAGLLDG